MSEQLTIDDEGARLRDEGIARVTENSETVHVTTIDRVIWLFNHGAHGRDSWSANDLRAFLDENYPDINRARPQLMGARVRAAAMRKEMRRVGYEPSTLPSTHAHPIAVWQGVQR